MASANLPEVKSFEPPHPRGLKHWFSGGLFLLTLAALFLTCSYGWSDNLAKALVVLSLGISGFLWFWHLRAGSLSGYWSCPLAALLICQLALPILYAPVFPAAAWFGAIGCGLFVYALLWVSAMHEGDPGLRPLATIALLLSIGVLAKPAVAISCALLSILFLFRSRGRFGGFANSILLLITPAMRCALAFLTVNFLVARDTHGAIFQSTLSYPVQSEGTIGLDLLSREAPFLWFPIAVLLSRLFERKTGMVDCSYFMLVSFLSTVGMAHWMPSALTPMDIHMIVYAGAACLLAMAPPKRAGLPLFILSGMAAPLLKLIPV